MRLDAFLQDVAYGLRLFRRAPGFTAVAIVTLALGIGANAAIFGVLKSVLLDALPYADADRLVHIFGPLSAGTVDEIRQRQRSFESVAAFTPFVDDAVYGSEGGPRSVQVAWVEPGFFDTIGVSAASGRTFTDDETASGLVPLSRGLLGADTARAVLVTHAAWERLFASSPGVLGRDVRINGIVRTIVGVLPPRFVGPMGPADFYLPFDVGPVIANPVTVRRSQWLAAVARLKPDLTQDAARRDVAGIWTGLASRYPQDNAGLHAAATPLRDALVGNTRTPLLLLMMSAALVLVIACANLASALLSRSISRRREFAIRVALGAGRRRLVHQLLTESVILALAGGAVGLLLGTSFVSVVRAVAPLALPAYADISLDAGAVVVTMLVALGTGLIFGAAPAFAVEHLDAQGTLRDEARGASEGRRSQRVRGLLVAGQVALCVSLLAGAGLLIRSLWQMATAPLGFEPAGILTAAIRLPAYDYPTPQTRIQFLERFVDRLRDLPGVQAAAIATSVPTAVRNRVGFAIEGAPAKDAQPVALSAVVSDDYFRVLRIPLRRGRTFDARDRFDAPPTVVISESTARRYWPTEGALGARIRMGPNLTSPLVTVVGIVGDVRNDPARQDAEPMAYRSSRQASAAYVRVLLRTQGSPPALVKPVERELAALNRGVPLDQPMTLGGEIGERFAARRLPVMLIAAFAGLALALASVGIYAMFSSMGIARQQEFGIRMALGSRPGAIAGLMLRQGAGWMAGGLAGGALGIVFVAQLLRGLLYDMPAFDPIALGGAVVVLVSCATIALLIPVRRATRVDPIAMLRAE